MFCSTVLTCVLLPAAALRAWRNAGDENIDAHARSHEAGDAYNLVDANGDGTIAVLDGCGQSATGTNRCEAVFENRFAGIDRSK